MQTNLVICVVAILAMISGTAWASENLTNRQAIHTETERFMEHARGGNLSGAYKHLRPYLGVESGPYDDSAKDAAAYFQRVTEQVGEPVGVSHVRTESIGQDFTRETWLQKFEAAAIAWRFTFYQPRDNGWKLVGVSYSTEMGDLYQKID